MFLKAGEIFQIMEKLAPLSLAENWDNVGMLTGSAHKNVAKILLALDVSELVITQAIESDVDLIISHHPFPFQAIKKVSYDEFEGRLLSLLLKNDIVLYAAHTNLDAAFGGVNDALAEKLGLCNVVPLDHSNPNLQKIVVFVPVGHEDSVMEAMSKAGAGHIGRYSHCSFRTSGKGTFRPENGTNPYIGECNEISFADEVRLETVVTADLSSRVIAAMMAAHPYEEVAYDLYSLQNKLPAVGPGRIGDLSLPMTLDCFATLVKNKLGAAQVRVAGREDIQIQRVAVCGGSGAEYFARAKWAGAQVLVTGDVKYHDAWKMTSSGLAVLDAGHFATEYPVLEKVQAYLQEEFNQGKVECEVAIAIDQQDIWRAIK